MAAMADILVVHYRMEETQANDPAVDAIGTYDLASGGNPPSAAGKVGNCRDVEASLGTQSFSAASDPVVVMSNSYSWGLMGWCQLESKPGTMHYVGKRNGNLDYWLRYDAGVDRFQFRVYTVAMAASTDVLADTLGSPATGTWYFVCCWYDHVLQTINICVNDGAVDSASHTGTVAGSAGAGFEIAAGGGGELWDGKVDEISVFKNGFPSASNITAIYNGGTGVDLTTLLTINDAAGGDDWTSPHRSPARSPASRCIDRPRHLRS
jgi:hypothetical protein